MSTTKFMQVNKMRTKVYLIFLGLDAWINIEIHIYVIKN